MKQSNKKNREAGVYSRYSLVLGFTERRRRRRKKKKTVKEIYKEDTETKRWGFVLLKAVLLYSTHFYFIYILV